MADDRSNVGEPDRRRVSESERYEVSYFTRKHGISAERARERIATHGNDRETLDREAEKLKI